MITGGHALIRCESGTLVLNASHAQPRHAGDTDQRDLALRASTRRA